MTNTILQILPFAALIIITLIAWIVLDPARPLKMRRYSKEVDRLLEVE